LRLWSRLFRVILENCDFTVDFENCLENRDFKVDFVVDFGVDFENLF